MPGAWEVIRNARVLVGILHVDSTTVAWSMGLRNLQIPGGGVLPVSGMPYDHARNEICKAALANGMSHVFMLDSDVIPPNDAIIRLLHHRQPIISGVYHRRSPPHGVPVMMRGGTWVTEYPANAVIEVDLVGAGCLLIETDCLRRLPPQRPGKHWFDWRVDLQGHHPREYCLSEDFTFMTHAKKHGIRTLVDTSVLCRHVGFAQATYGSFVPMETLSLT